MVGDMTRDRSQDSMERDALSVWLDGWGDSPNQLGGLWTDPCMVRDYTESR